MRLRIGCVRASSFAMVCIGIVSLALAVSARGQNAATGTSGQPASGGQTPSGASSTTPPAQRPPKVWTNDDLSSLRGQSDVSSAGSGVRNPKTTGKAPQPAPKAKTAYYQNRIARLQAQIPPIDSQISQLQSAISGTSPDTPRKYIGVKLDDWQAEMTQLQKKRADIVSQIGALEDQARHEGVPTNSLP
jgi:uncharacterized protein YukE